MVRTCAWTHSSLGRRDDCVRRTTYRARGVLDVVQHHAPETVPGPPRVLLDNVLDEAHKLGLPVGRMGGAQHVAHVVEGRSDVVGLRQKTDVPRPP